MSDLKLIKDFLHEANSKITWCHWKSNTSLGDALRGITDLDILVDKKDKEVLVQLFKELKVIKFKAVPERYYPNIEDWIGVDCKTGNIVHFHIHYALDVGEKYYKAYKLPFEVQVLKDRVWNKQYELWTTSPEWEMTLLIIRVCLRERLTLSSKKVPTVGRATLEEFHDLLTKMNRAKYEELVRLHYSKEIESLFVLIIDNGMCISLLKVLGEQLRRHHYVDKQISDPSYLALRVKRALKIRVKLFFKKYGYPVAFSRLNITNGGKVVSFVGVDGSGKSTILALSKNQFSKKMDVFTVYLGHGASGLSGLVNLGRLGKSGFDFFYLKSIGLCWWSCFRALDKLNKFYLIRYAKSKGFLILTDRYPQNKFSLRMDGPVFSDENDCLNPIVIFSRAFERFVYKKFAELKIDVFFKLEVTAAESASRKTGINIEEIVKKIHAFDNLRFDNAKRFITSKDQTIEERKLVVINEIFKGMNEPA